MKIKLYTTIILSTLIAFVSCKEEKKTKETVLRPVKYTVVGDVNTQKIRTFSGVAKAGDEIELSFRGSGIITKVNVRKGQKVKKGDVIAKLDNVEASLAYEQSVSALKSAKSSMNTSKSNLNRVKSLYEKGSNSLSDYEQAKNSYQTALDQFESAKRNKSIQATQLSYGVIKAPKGGLIADTKGRVGERVGAGHQFAILNAGKEMKIEVGLPETVVNKVTIGMVTKLEFSALEGKGLSGTVIEVSPIIDTDAATYKASIGIDTPLEEIKPGMASSVTFDFSEVNEIANKSLIIPVKAVGEDGKGRFVFVISSKDGKKGKVNKHHIELGELTTDGFKVKSGLKNGDRIATAGLQTLLNGQQVRLK